MSDLEIPAFCMKDKEIDSHDHDDLMSHVSDEFHEVAAIVADSSYF